MSTTSANASTARARPRPTLTIGVTGHRTLEQVDHPQIDRAIATNATEYVGNPFLVIKLPAIAVGLLTPPSQVA